MPISMTVLRAVEMLTDGALAPRSVRFFAGHPWMSILDVPAKERLAISTEDHKTARELLACYYESLIYLDTSG